MTIRTRFAPSPTGELHIGNIRTALYAWLFSKQQKGKFILRIENTNFSNTTTDNYIANIFAIMRWLHLDWDEGPYFQSDRLNRYDYIINDMLKYNIAYKCYCSLDRLKMLRLKQMKDGQKPKYDGYCRMKNHMGAISNSNNDCTNNKSNPYVVRFANPLSGKVTFYDHIRGMITVDNTELDDVIICRTNGVPTYNFCVVIDDMDMKITHVIRGEEHINNTPRQINILKSLNATIPQYVHVPIILDGNRQKLSKRHGQVGMITYKDGGFLPEAILNYLVRLGWSYGNQEIFSVEQMKKYFSFNKVSRSASVFDFKRLLWLNNYYINNLPVEYVAKYLLQYMEEQNIDAESIKPKLFDVVQLLSKRSNTLREMVLNFLSIHREFNIFDNPTIADKFLTPIILPILKILIKKLNAISTWTISLIKLAIKETIYELRMDISIIGMPLRIALIGSSNSPELSTIIYFLGKYQALYRLKQAEAYINK
ncbi:glutamyl-tRNA synthetase [Candidatus Blochmanniella vafra str. BVAF]|uniref:Glutamate--tRNA ligase n=1 Tax=Blochmanniella vafra (strain BVAF) TaxID=859654 RepID=E8Q765_BLOVB|nr:glutamate--tRNA ligase [Candidatus Blochmannia vafer]ADV33889.1 glutamyl-tRNA synthetase [Candidatus Blochmannia vafer str. BVAF]